MAAYASAAVLLRAGWAALNPAPMAWVYIAVVIAFEVWLARRMINLGRNAVSAREAPYHFSEDEAQLVGRYRFYFTYPALARESASVLAAIGLSALVLAFWLLYKQAFVQAVLAGVNLLGWPASPSCWRLRWRCASPPRAATAPRCACSKRTIRPGPRSAPPTVFRIWVKVRRD